MSNNEPDRYVWLKRDAPSARRQSERARIYIGGPLNGHTAAKVDGLWPHFRDDTGQPLNEGAGDTAMGQEPSTDRHAYYLAGLPGEGGWAYVHLSLWDKYLAAMVFGAAHAAAIVANEDARGG